MSGGRVLALDYGSKRIGVAISDPLSITAQPLGTIASDRLAEELLPLVETWSVAEVVVGLPVSLDGSEGASASAARQLAELVTGLTGLKVTMVDERFTTRIAESAMLEAGVKRRKRRQRADRLAATVFLQSYLDSKE